MLKRFCVGFTALCLGAVGFGSLMGGAFCAVCLGFPVPVPLTVLELLLALTASTVAAVLLKPIINAYPKEKLQ